ncbi:MAG TPA: PPOX class F420-dependent oxidoreductase, partial [Myxococcota bacterium]|nr:PPOX class F420-dependent oxidoreductase [Myxococcota bacterium]
LATGPGVYTMDASARSALDRERYVSLETFRKTGRAVATPVWFALAGDRFYVFSEADAGKVKRLRNDPRVRVSACNVRGRVHGPPLAGRAARRDDAETAARAYAALRAKYGWQMRLTDFFSRLAGRIDHRAILEIELDGPAAD